MNHRSKAKGLAPTNPDGPASGSRRITILPFLLDASVAADLPRVAGAVQTTFVVPVRVASGPLAADAAHDARRGQYNSRALLELLVARTRDAREHILGITSVDLFMPVLTYVFGEALLDGNAAVVSTCRLDPVMYGLPAAPQRVVERLISEAVHELGHNFGLTHCRDPRCVMAASTYAEQIDLKTPRFCRTCAPVVAAGR